MPVLFPFFVHPFGAEIYYVKPKASQNKSMLKDFPGYYMHPANYHSKLNPFTKSTSTSLILLRHNGKFLISKTTA